jgi:hypothetical protein
MLKTGRVPLGSQAMLLRVLAFVAFLAGPAPAAAQGGSLNEFLADIIENSCEGSAAFRVFRESLREKYANISGPGAPRRTMNPNAKILFPDGVRSAIGRAVISNKGESTEVRVPVVGTFRGLGVTAIVFGFGDNNGVSWLAILFSSPIVGAKHIGPGCSRGNRKLNAQSEEVSAPGSDRMSIISLAGKPSLICDRSA